MPKTKLRGDIDKELESNLLLQDDSTFQIIRQLHRQRGLQMFECAAVVGGLGFALRSFL